MKRKAFILMICSILSLAPFMWSFAQDEEDDGGYPEYPDGSYGIDLGDDWQVMPEGGKMKFIGDQATRGEYVNTAEYGPITGKGFEIFPEFQWEGPAAKAAQKAEETRMYYIYYEATTAPREIPEEMQPGEKEAKKENAKAAAEEMEERYIGAGESGTENYKNQGRR